MNSPVSLPADGKITLARWADPLVERSGHPVRGEYVEQFWLGVLGPTATWLLRRCAAEVDRTDAPVVLDLGVLAASLGLAHHAGRHNPFSRGLGRCIMFGLMREFGPPAAPRALEVRTHAPVLPARHLARLPVALQTAHADWLAGATAVVSVQA
ncbi:MAG: hypothetical protein RLZZ305_432 [Actinomycetota bacterium]